MIAETSLRPLRRPQSRLALRETIEAFTAADGNIYVLRGSTDAEFVIEDPSPLDRAIVELLHSPVTVEELCDGLGRRGHAPDRDDVAAKVAQLEEIGIVSEHPVAYPGLSAEERGRYDRQLAYFGDLLGDGAPAVGAQQRLLTACVTIIGCGALGSWTAAGLACAGIGRLVLVDDDTVELSNLNRQLLFRRDDVGRRKVDAAAVALTAFNPDLEVERVHRRVGSASDVERLARGADLVVGTADSPPHEIARWLNTGCLAAGVPHVTAAQFSNVVRVGPLFRPGVTGCHACQEQAARDGYPEYDALMAYRRRRRISPAALGPPSALVGSVLSMDAVHLITGTATPATEGRALVADMRELRFEVDEVPRDERCPECGISAQAPIAARTG